MLTVFSSVVLGVACFFALRAVWPVFSGIEWAVTTAHEVEHFFLGKVVYDPGWLFYLFALSIKSLLFVLPLAVRGCAFLVEKEAGDTTGSAAVKDRGVSQIHFGSYPPFEDGRLPSPLGRRDLPVSIFSCRRAVPVSMQLMSP